MAYLNLANINEILQKMVEIQASDLHIRLGQKPIFRVQGSLIIHDEYTVIENNDLKKIIFDITNEYQREFFKEHNELDLSYSLSGIARFRVNLFRTSSVIGLVFRVVPVEIPKKSQLNLPAGIDYLIKKQRGLILVTGPTGSGKSTTLAAIIDHINSSRKCNIVTIEDPIEFLHKDIKACVVQREVGMDVKSYEDGISIINRLFPDVIVIGELRTGETIKEALLTAGSGKLVFATMHTVNTIQSIERILNSFSQEERPQIQQQMASCLQGIVAQTLIPLRNKQKRIASFEIMINTAAVKNLLKENNLTLLFSTIENSNEIGMQSSRQSLSNLLQNNLITYSDALLKCDDRFLFEQMVESNDYLKKLKAAFDKNINI